MKDKEILSSNLADRDGIIFMTGLSVFTYIKVINYMIIESLNLSHVISDQLVISIIAFG